MDKMNISMVAKKANVSQATVSRVLNNSKLVSETTARHVRGIISELGYRPSELARGLRMSETKTLGVIVSNILNPFFTGMVRGIEDVANRANYNIVLCNTDEDPQKEKQYLQTLLSKQVDGLIVATTGQQNHYAEMGRRTPIVFVDRRPDCQGGLLYDTILADNRGGSYRAVEHLLQAGYRNIAIITGSNVATTGSERLLGYQDALRTNGIPLCPQLIKEGDFLGHTAYEQARELLAQAPCCDAVFTANHMILLGVLQALSALQLASPADIGLVSFDDTEWMKYCVPRLTAVAQPTYRMGAMAVELLLERMTSHENIPSREIILPVTLEIRDSSKSRAAAVC